MIPALTVTKYTILVVAVPIGGVILDANVIHPGNKAIKF